MIPTLIGSLVVTACLCGSVAARSADRRRMLSRAGARDPVRARTARPLGRYLRYGLAGALGLAVSFAIAGPVGSVVAAVAAVTVPRALRRRRSAARGALLQAQLASAVSGVAAAMRAGLSLSQSIRFAAAEASAPVSDDLAGVAEREDLGVPLDESIERWGRHASGSDVRLVADVLRLRIGSGLPRVLDQVCRTLREREATRKEVRSLTAQARLSGTILGLLPIAFFVFLSITSRHDMTAAYSSPLGVGAIVGGLVLQGLAFLWIRKLVAVQA